MEVEGITLKRFPNKEMFPRAENSVKMKLTGDARLFRLSKFFGGPGTGVELTIRRFFRFVFPNSIEFLSGGGRSSNSRKLGYPPVRNWALEASRVIAAWDTGKTGVTETAENFCLHPKLHPKCTPGALYCTFARCYACQVPVFTA